MIPSMDMISEILSVVARAVTMVAGSSLLTFGLGIAIYILQALGIYTIAMRRGIKHPWMAWLPLVNMWVLGSISDQYRYVVKGQIRNRRKVLIGLYIAILALGLVFFCVAIGMLVNLLVQIPQLLQMTPEQALQSGAGLLILTVCYALLVWVLNVIALVFQYVCLYDLYGSCCPDNQVLFLVLSILFNVTMPFFVFACRNKDGGMPPRKEDAQKQTEEIPVVEGIVEE